MNERYLDRSTYESVDHAALLKEQLESGETAHFDAGSIMLLKEISARENHSAILQSAIDVGVVSTKSFGSKIAGVFGALGGGSIGAAHTTRVVSEYLSEKFTLNPADVKAIPNNAMQAVEGVFNTVAGGVDSEVVQASKDAAGSIGSFFKNTVDSAHNFVVDSGGGDVLKTGSETLATVTDAISAGTSRGVDVAVENIQQTLVQPTVDATADAVGSLSYIPSAAIGYLLASGFIGGTAGVVEQMRRESGYARVSELITSSKVSGSGGHVGESDPRLELIAEFARYSQASESNNICLTQAQWLTFASEVRRAKCSLLREKVRAPEIVLDEEKLVLEKKRRVIDSIILNTQSELAHADSELATIILAQFDANIAEAINPIEAAHARQQLLSRKILKYSQVFVRSGLKATGIPTLWRGFKQSVRRAGKIILPL